MTEHSDTHDLDVHDIDVNDFLKLDTGLMDGLFIKEKELMPLIISEETSAFHHK